MTGPIVLQNSITNTVHESRINAQYVGDLNASGTYSIDLSATLPKGDTGDYYKVRVTSANTYLNFSSIQQDTQSTPSSSSSPLTDLFQTGALRFQLYSQTGRLMADSNPNSGAAYQAYQALNSGKNLEVNAGTYTMKVSPGTNYDATVDYGYILTLRANGTPVNPASANTSRREFFTTANPASTQWAATATTTTSTTSVLSATVLSTTASLQQTLESQATGSLASVGNVINLLA